MFCSTTMNYNCREIGSIGYFLILFHEAKEAHVLFHNCEWVRLIIPSRWQKHPKVSSCLRANSFLPIPFQKFRPTIPSKLYSTRIRTIPSSSSDTILDIPSTLLICFWPSPSKPPPLLSPFFNNTAEKLFTGVIDTAYKFFGVVSDTGD